MPKADRVGIIDQVQQFLGGTTERLDAFDHFLITKLIVFFTEHDTHSPGQSLPIQRFSMSAALQRARPANAGPTSGRATPAPAALRTSSFHAASPAPPCCMTATPHAPLHHPLPAATAPAGARAPSRTQARRRIAAAASSSSSEFSIETLNTWLLREEMKGRVDRDLVPVVSSIATACKQISALVARAPLVNLTGGVAAVNASGDEQKKVGGGVKAGGRGADCSVYAVGDCGG